MIIKERFTQFHLPQFEGSRSSIGAQSNISVTLNYAWDVSLTIVWVWAGTCFKNAANSSTVSIDAFNFCANANIFFK